MKLKMISILTVLFSLCFSFNILAMPENRNANEPVSPTPSVKTKNEDGVTIRDWTWINDNVCVEFRAGIHKNIIDVMYESEMLTCWRESGTQKTRDTYAGKWMQSPEGVWSFEFDDYTIPIGVTNIDGVLYAFNTFGELQEGYNYWGDLITGADGLVVSDNPEFLEWLTTQYIPACTSHE